jgi:Trk-type K+ transport system membrane component
MYPYLSFQANVGRNSNFKGLTTEQQEELGGVEYRALKLLLRITVAYWLVLQLIAVLAIAPYLATSRRWSSELAGPNSRSSSTWYAFFQVWSAFANCGLSLNDASMVPFQEAYWMQIVLGFLILAGNTAYPILLRLVIWTLSRMVTRQSQLWDTLRFLLDHPRRCFLYLFPMHQTMLLVSVKRQRTCERCHLLTGQPVRWRCF